MPNKILKTLEIAGEPFDVPQGTGTVSGVKGQQETDYREGNVNLTPNNILYLGTNPTGGVANDTIAFWNNKPSGYAYFSQANQLKNQPNAYGYLEHLTFGNGMWMQTFHANGGKVYHRYYSGSVTEPSTWIEFASTSFVQDTITARLPKALEKTGTVANFNLATGTATMKDCFTVSATGTIFVTAFAQFAANATGSRSFSIYIAGSGTGSGSILPGAAGVTLGIGASAIGRVSSGGKVQLRFLQSSGASLAISNIQYRAYLIKD